MTACFLSPRTPRPFLGKGQKVSPRDEFSGLLAVEGEGVRDSCNKIRRQFLPSLPKFPKLGTKLSNIFNNLHDKGGKG